MAVLPPPGLEHQQRTPLDRCVVAEAAHYLKCERQGAWTPGMHLYRYLHTVNAGDNSSDFVTPSELVERLRLSGMFEVRYTSDGTPEVRSVPLQLRREPAHAGRAVAGILRYGACDPDGWMSLRELQERLRGKVVPSHMPDKNELLDLLLADQRRFEVALWKGRHWARATYRH